MRSALKKSKYLLIALLISGFIFATPVRAESWTAWFQTQFSVNTILYSMLCQLIGCGIEAKPQADASGVIKPTIVYNENPQHIGGLLGFGATTMIALYDNPPTSSTYYLANIGKEFGISSAYAQVEGSGAGLIKPVEQLWQILRNVSYLFFIIIFVVIGFMIMLRQKLNPQTVVTIQSALPGLVIGLILVTFSYFIAALITDMAFLGVQLVAQIFASIADDKGIVNYFDPQTLANRSNIFDIYLSAMSSAKEPAKTYIDGSYLNTLTSAGGTAATAAADNASTYGVFAAIIGGVIFAFSGGWALVPAAAGVGLGLLALPLIVVVVLMIAFTIQFLKIIFKLFMAYIMILITTALGPLYITMSMLPGRSGMLGMWWKTILGNALVFPAVFALFLFAGMIMKTDPSAWQSTPPLLGNFSTRLIQPIIAFCIILGIPAVPDMVKKAVGAADLGAIGSTGTGGFMAGWGAGSGAFKKAYERRMAPLNSQREAYQKAYASHLATGTTAPSYGPPGGGAPRTWRPWNGIVDWAQRRYVTGGRT